MAVALAANWEHRQMESPSSPSPTSNSRTNNDNENSSQNSQQPQANFSSSAGSDAASSQPQQTSHGQPQIQQPFVAQPTPWTPSPNAAPFYPSFNPFFQQNPGLAVPQQQPYFDPNAQMALAYQHMIMQQAHVLQQQQAAAALQFNIRNAAGHPEFFAQHQQPHPIMTGFPFGTATPPPHPAYPSPPLPGALSPPGFRRGPQRPNASDASGQTSNDWARMHTFPQVPYARPDAAGSSNSVNSSTGSGQNPSVPGGQRVRTESNGGNSAHGSPSGSLRGHGRVAPISTNAPETRVRSLSTGSPTARGPPLLHQRTVSNSSDRAPSIRQNSISSVGSSTSPQPQQQPSQPSSPANRAVATRTVKPSPLSQQSTTFEGTSKANKRLSKDDSELLPQAPQVHASRSGGLKSRFKRALTLNALDETSAPPSSAGQDGVPSPSTSSIANTIAGSSSVSAATVGDTSIRTTKPKSRSLFNGRFNASTDNISLSSTVSSASVMIRKLGSIGKLARKNSLSGITKLFKDKDKDKGEGGSGGGLSFGRKKGKGATVEASVSMATAEIDRFEDPSLKGLSPAAQLARQHTLRSNAEAAASRLREQHEAANTNNASSANGAASVGGVPSAWDKDTASRAGGLPRHGNVGEEGRWVPDRISEDGESGEGGYDPIDEEDEDATVRLSRDRSEEDEPDEHEQWAVGINREVERTKQPSKSILRNAKGYVQEQYLENGKEHFLRSRANSHNTTITTNTEPGPLAHIPSPDPDHIDGLQKPSNVLPSDTTFTLPPLEFDFNTSDALKSSDVPKVDSTAAATSSPSGGAKTIPNDKDMVTAADRGPSFAYTHPAANSSAPVLSSMPNRSAPIAKTPSAPGLGKKISFAQNLAIYDTFSPSVYDRRSEPSTANRLTPTLAQRIKEELNSFKMEEMEVHSASRIHTHFFV